MIYITNQRENDGLGGGNIWGRRVLLVGEIKGKGESRHIIGKKTSHDLIHYPHICTKNNIIIVYSTCTIAIQVSYWV